jgi:MinD-like ATPase involved in chromosome partitioning or flagellar assembly
MSERQARSGGDGRMSSTPVKPLRRVRMLSSGRWHAPMDSRLLPTVIAVGAAAPGLGKSVVVSNLAASIAGLGRRVVVVDLDYRAPRQHTLFGVASPEGGLQAWLERKRARQDELAQPTKLRNLRILPAPAVAAAPPSRDERLALVRELNDLDSDVILIDVGAENRDDLFDFFAINAVRLLVTSRAPAALQATYAFLKSAVLRAERKHGANARDNLARFAGGLVGNSIDAPEQEETFHAFSRLVREHLGIPLPVVGCLKTSERIAQSIVARQPLIARRGIDGNVRQFDHMADAIMKDERIGEHACALDGEPIDVPVGPLPAAVERYARKHVRFPVDWAASLELATEMTAVRVRDVSESGAGVETALRLRVGDTGVLHLDQISGQPRVPVIVKSIVPASNRVGLAFTEKSRATARLAAAARAAAAQSSA